MLVEEPDEVAGLDGSEESRTLGLALTLLGGGAGCAHIGHGLYVEVDVASHTGCVVGCGAGYGGIIGAPYSKQTYFHIWTEIANFAQRYKNPPIIFFHNDEN